MDDNSPILGTQDLMTLHSIGSSFVSHKQIMLESSGGVSARKYLSSRLDYLNANIPSLKWSFSFGFAVASEGVIKELYLGFPFHFKGRFIAFDLACSEAIDPFTIISVNGGILTAPNSFLCFQAPQYLCIHNSCLEE